MKFKFSYFLGLTFILFAGIVFSGNAQERIPNNEIPDLDFLQPDFQIQEEKPLLFEPTDSTEKTLLSREELISIQKSGKNRSGEGSKNQASLPEEEDALSFNFLFYIIQKFKISDIVEE